MDEQATKPQNDAPVLEIEALVHRLSGRTPKDQFVLNIPHKISIPRGAFVVVLGPSGCGKTTLLSILGLLRAPSGLAEMGCFRMRVEENGVSKEFNIKEAYQRRRNSLIERLRQRYIGFALQSGELLPALTVQENIALPLQLNGVSGRECWNRVSELMTAFGLRDEPEDGQAGETNTDTQWNRLAGSRVNKISGGEYQRVSLARSISHHPALVFVDEPTANLNGELARQALAYLRSVQQKSEHGMTVFMITHDKELSEEFADYIIKMKAHKTDTGAEGTIIDIQDMTGHDDYRFEFDGPGISNTKELDPS